MDYINHWIPAFAGMTEGVDSGPRRGATGLLGGLFQTPLYYLGRLFQTRLYHLGGLFPTPLYHLHPCRRASMQAYIPVGVHPCRHVHK